MNMINLYNDICNLFCEMLQPHPYTVCQHKIQPQNRTSTYNSLQCSAEMTGGSKMVTIFFPFPHKFLIHDRLLINGNLFP